MVPSTTRWRPWALAERSVDGAGASKAGSSCVPSALSAGARPTHTRDVVLVGAGELVLQDSRRFFVTQPNVSVPPFAAETEAKAINDAMRRAHDRQSTRQQRDDGDVAVPTTTASAAATARSGIECECENSTER